MSLFENQQFIGMADRLGKQVDNIVTAVNNSAVSGVSGLHFDIVASQTPPDYEVMNDLHNESYNLDAQMDGMDALVGVPYLYNLFSAIRLHVRKEGGYTGLNAYLTDKSIDVSSPYADGHYRATREKLDASNVFAPQISGLGGLEVTSGISGLSDVFTAGNQWDGSGDYSSVVPYNYTDTKFDLVVDSDSVDISGTAWTVRISIDTGEESPETEDVEIAIGATAGDVFPAAGSGTTLSGFQITNIASVSGDASGYKVSARTVPKRTIQL